MFMVNNLIGFGGRKIEAGGSAFAGSYEDSQANGTDGTSQTFSSMGIGTAAADRYVYAAILAKRSGTPLTISSVTIGGVSASALVTQANADSNQGTTAIYVANVTSGTTADVVVNYNASVLRGYCSTFRIVGASSPTSVSDSASSAADPISLNMNIPSGDSFAFGIGFNNSGSATATWTGLTEQDDRAVEGAQVRGSVASDTFASSETNRTIECNFTTTGQDVGCAVVIA